MCILASLLVRDIQNYTTCNKYPSIIIFFSSLCKSKALVYSPKSYFTIILLRFKNRNMLSAGCKRCTHVYDETPRTDYYMYKRGGIHTRCICILSLCKFSTSTRLVFGSLKFVCPVDRKIRRHLFIIFVGGLYACSAYNTYYYYHRHSALSRTDNARRTLVYIMYNIPYSRYLSIHI